ncbi:hypothetical protein KC332_g16303 [Hortaea werneckii]|uniref:Uncharacterized protein n=1 Tax=Hortaea werneckii TaxID=91943 RepID=A0A3M7J4C3_HORWE|nr:hypothetical protein KC350_g16799 [Hortaea werneckii]KAI6797176.1 hypothetical protein KC358_g16458 [Hortaea werneckii]KAI6900626.1 hypothetical protein KC348_g16766 [Hortaea werneckii]KAI6920286.1 hypothetical protein KC341_g16700 [Hortaea werneckii]KAI6962360.1 hypothetical protein KC329_g16366 [Hortaea werneckii]
MDGDAVLSTCPLPEVAEALGPFIKPRDEVSRIRQELQSYLQKQAGSADVPLSTANVTASSERDVLSPGPALSGVRKAYLQALRAHSEAQGKHDRLRADLGRLSAESLDENKKTNTSASVTENHLPLLRQRERQRKLQAIQRAFEGISSTGKAATNAHIDDLVRQKAGDLPAPPSVQQQTYSDKPDVDSRVLELKKAIIATKRRVDLLTTSDSTSNEEASRQSKAEVAGLQAALQELTIWMEDQLSLIGNAEGDSQAAPLTPSTGEQATSGATSSVEDIGALYEDYIDARERLITTINSPPSTTTTPDASRSGSRSPPSRDIERRASPAETLLPHIRRLASTKLNEQALLQQSAYLRRQVSAAESEDQRLILRLADESHIVQPGASKGKDWAEAGREASRATTEAASERLKAGEKATASAKRALKDIEYVPKVFEDLS